MLLGEIDVVRCQVSDLALACHGVSDCPEVTLGLTIPGRDNPIRQSLRNQRKFLRKYRVATPGPIMLEGILLSRTVSAADGSMAGGGIGNDGPSERNLPLA